jgi:hypothetical protein
MAEGYDWRLTGQERFLAGVTFHWSEWRQSSPEWEHDHCAFCWAKFMETALPGVLGAGYTTADTSYWVCATCFKDFRARFAWKLVGEADGHDQFSRAAASVLEKNAELYRRLA